METTYIKSSFVTKVNVRESFLLLFMAFVTLSLYYPAILGPYSILDDLIESTGVLNTPTWSYLGDLFSLSPGNADGPKSYTRPLSAAVYFIVAKVFVLHAGAFHLLSVLFHLGCGFMVYFIFKRIYGKESWGIWPAFTAAMIFLVHPLNVEAVAWISARPTVMSTFFILLAFFYHLRVGRDLKDWRLWIAALCYLLSLLSYELAAAMPLAFFFWDMDQSGYDDWRQAARKCWPRWIPYGLALAVYLAFRLLRGFALGAGGSEGGPLFLTVFDAYLRSFTSPFVAIGFYLKKAFWPWPLDYHIHSVFRPPYLVLGIVFLLGLLWLLWKRTWWRFWVFWFFCGLVMILPISFIGTSWTPAAERYVYISSIGFAVLVSIFAFKILPARIRWGVQAAQISVLVLLFVFGTGTALRTKIWQSNLTLLEDTLEKSPDNARVTAAYASALLSTPGRKEEAVDYFKKAIELGWVTKPAMILGRIEEEKKNYAAAEQYYMQALWPQKEMPKEGRSLRVDEMYLTHKRSPEVYLDLARLHQKMAEEEPERQSYHFERIVHFHQAATKLKPHDAYLKYLLAKAHLHYAGSQTEARKLFAEVSHMAPDTYYGKAAAKLAKTAKVKMVTDDVGAINSTTTIIQ